MTVQLLPPDFDEQARGAVQAFWSSRAKPRSGKQGGTRDAVVSGQNMNAFVHLVRVVAVHCGLPGSSVHTRKSFVVLPGYFRATKNWDVLVIHGGRLLAVFEFKSQVGSLGKNGNNRSEEVIGAAEDLRVAHLHGAFIEREPGSRWTPSGESVRLEGDPRPPFLGWMMLLEETAEALAPVRVAEPHYKVFPEFVGASYADR